MSDDDTPFNTVLSPEAFQAFMDQLDNPPEPSEALKALMRRPSLWKRSDNANPRLAEIEITDEMVNRAARAMSVHDCDGDETVWNDELEDDDYKQAYRRTARVALEAALGRHSADT